MHIWIHENLREMFYSSKMTTSIFGYTAFPFKKMLWNVEKKQAQNNIQNSEIWISPKR